MMVAQIVGLQQIVITFAFLSFLIGLLVFLRIKGGSIKANLQKGQRIKVIEETAISPTCLLYTSPSPRDQRGSRMPSSA